MPYSKVSDAPANIRELDDVALTLAQVNWIANVADGLDPDEVESVWAVAIAQFKRSFVKQDGKWVKRKKESAKEAGMEADRMSFLSRVMDFVGLGKKDEGTKDLSLDDIRQAIGQTLRPVEVVAREEGAWVQDLYPEGNAGYAIVRKGKQMFKVPYTIGEDEKLELGTPTPVKVTYQEVRPAAKELMGGFKVVEADGVSYWISRTTNAFQDSEEELFTTQALDEYVAQVDKGIPEEIKLLLDKVGLPSTNQGELWLAHTPASRIGEPTWKGVEGRFLIEVGTFDDTELGKVAAAHFKEHGEDYRMSHGYLYHPADKAEGVYQWLWKFETSPLPAGWEANPWTGINIIAKEVKVMDEQKKKWLVETLGQELADGILAKAAEDSKSLEELGITFKEKEEAGEEGGEGTKEPYVLEKDSKAMELLAEAVAEKLQASEVFTGTKSALEGLAKRIEAIEKADKPLAVLAQGFRASQAESTEVDTKEVPEGAMPSDEHILDKQARQRRQA